MAISVFSCKHLWRTGALLRQSLNPRTFGEWQTHRPRLSLRNAKLIAGWHARARLNILQTKMKSRYKIKSMPTHTNTCQYHVNRISLWHILFSTSKVDGHKTCQALMLMDGGDRDSLRMVLPSANHWTSKHSKQQENPKTQDSKTQNFKRKCCSITSPPVNKRETTNAMIGFEAFFT